MDDNDGALQSIRSLLQCKDASYFEINHAALALVRLSPSELISIAESPALISMEDDDQVQIATRLSSMKGGFEVSEKIIGRIREVTKDSNENVRVGTYTMSLGLIGGQRYDEAIEENLRALEKDIAPSEIIGCTFNLAMAKWAQEGTPDKILFQKVVDMEDDKRRDLNYIQCLAIVHFIVGDIDKAKSLLIKAKRIANSGPVRAFSAWSYTEVNQSTFKEHLLEMQEMIEGENIRPRFIKWN
jgi:tetratricopeptide (TPR) repeat protein